ncbi:MULTISPECIES: hypothetical protein [Pseudobutyrivibrio]|uniref:Uncharacterized protein n=1 Tax=Pseudobutyrivibrio xylanivorans TaxID=185007 RepID=A0A6M0LFY4_PSEXY|nr:MULTISPECIES: hypothetical protein [Pseudobutyrivibrio]NEX00769.1 hypothetical protein [Pseudobutyrivibrio xylanivorans]
MGFLTEGQEYSISILAVRKSLAELAILVLQESLSLFCELFLGFATILYFIGKQEMMSKTRSVCEWHRGI